MKQAPSAVFTSLAGFREEVEARDATDMNGHIRAAMNLHGTVNSISSPGHFQLGHLFVSKRCRIKDITAVLSQSRECQEKVEAMVMSLDLNTVAVLWENKAAWGRLWGALMRLSSEEMVVYKNRLRNHLSALCSRLAGEQRNRADEFFTMSKQDDAACEEVASHPFPLFNPSPFTLHPKCCLLFFFLWAYYCLSPVRIFSCPETRRRLYILGTRPGTSLAIR